MENPTPYRGYLIYKYITPPGFYIMKDNVAVSHFQASLEGAKKTIDELVGDK